MAITEKSSRLLFGAELLTLVAPTHVILFFFLFYNVLMSSFMIMVSFEEHGGERALMLGVNACIIVLSATAALALLIFDWMILNFILYRTTGLQQKRRKFLLIFGLIVLPITGPLPILAVYDGGLSVTGILVLIYASGLALLVPALHIWLELRFRRTSSLPMTAASPEPTSP